MELGLTSHAYSLILIIAEAAHETSKTSSQVGTPLSIKSAWLQENKYVCQLLFHLR
jgi:hypothetical protein